MDAHGSHMHLQETKKNIQKKPTPRKQSPLGTHFMDPTCHKEPGSSSKGWESSELEGSKSSSNKRSSGWRVDSRAPEYVFVGIYLISNLYYNDVSNFLSIFRPETQPTPQDNRETHDKNGQCLLPTNKTKPNQAQRKQLTKPNQPTDQNNSTPNITKKQHKFTNPTQNPATPNPNRNQIS